MPLGSKGAAKYSLWMRIFFFLFPYIQACILQIGQKNKTFVHRENREKPSARSTRSLSASATWLAKVWCDLADCRVWWSVGHTERRRNSQGTEPKYKRKPQRWRHLEKGKKGKEIREGNDRNGMREFRIHTQTQACVHKHMANLFS